MNASSLIEKYRPRTLADLRGQPEATGALVSFVKSPYPAAFLFHGPSGTGKTCAAWALANDLGCHVDEAVLGGVHEIPSGQQDGRAVQELLRALSLRPLFGNGWKVAIVNEADHMTTQAEAMWLDGLEHLPPRSVIVFTTNDTSRLSQRFKSRCEPIGFAGNGEFVQGGLSLFVAHVWKAETGHKLSRVPDNVGKFDMAGGNYSFRLALQQLAPYIRSGAKLPEAFHPPFIREEEELRQLSATSAAKKAWATRRERTVANV